MRQRQDSKLIALLRMSKGRLEAFSDGVLAIVITIMVLELHAPEAATLEALLPTIPIFLSYALSFVFVGIYWNNHHHLLQATKQVNGKVLWANLHLLFWLSLVPFTAAWVGEHFTAAWPIAAYGIVLLMAAIAYNILSNILINLHGKDSTIATAIGSDLKGKLSLGFYLAAIPLAFVSTWISVALYVAVALIWFVPDQRIERTIGR